jgi:hypothetical protein
LPSQHIRHLLLVDNRLRVGLSGCCRRCGCRRHLNLKHLKLLLEIDNCHCPLLELKVLLLDVVLEVYDRVHALIQHLTSGVLLLAEIVPPMLSIAEAVVRDLKLMALV